jgi:hypothetical protein
MAKTGDKQTTQAGTSPTTQSTSKPLQGQAAGSASTAAATKQGIYESLFSGVPRGGIPMVLEYPIGFDINQLIDDWSIETTQEGAVICSLLMVLGRIPDNGQVIHDVNPIEPTWIIAKATDTEPQVELTQSSPENNKFPAETAWFKSVMIAYSRAPGWTIDLVGCYQVSPLSNPNLVNYFASQGGIKVNGNRILPIIRAASGAMDSVMADGQLREMIFRPLPHDCG